MFKNFHSQYKLPAFSLPGYRSCHSQVSVAMEQPADMACHGWIFFSGKTKSRLPAFESEELESHSHCDHASTR